MSIWNKETVAKVRGLYTIVFIDRMNRISEDELKYIKLMTAKNFVLDAQPFAVDVHLEDLDFKLTPEAFGRHRLRCWWMPKTTEVEFFGGPAHSEIRILPPSIVPDSSFVVQTYPIMLASPTTNPSEEIKPNRVVYAMSGWSEAERRWIYSPS